MQVTPRWSTRLKQFESVSSSLDVAGSSLTEATRVRPSRLDFLQKQKQIQVAVIHQIDTQVFGLGGEAVDSDTLPSNRLKIFCSKTTLRPKQEFQAPILITTTSQSTVTKYTTSSAST